MATPGSRLGEMAMIAHHHPSRQVVVETVCAIAGMLVGMLVAFACTWHLSMGIDPVGVIGTWVTAAALSGSWVR
jgi:hypothetical protein